MARIPVAGTRWYFNYLVDRMLQEAGEFDEAKQDYYTAVDFAARSWTRNPACWFKGDLSACAVYHTYQTMQPHDGLLTMVSWREDTEDTQHGVCASHHSIVLPQDGWMYWVHPVTGETIEAKLADRRENVGTLLGGTPTDLSIYKLDRPIPVNAIPVRPRNWQAYQPYDPSPYGVNAWASRLPLVTMNRARTPADGVYATPPFHDSRRVRVMELMAAEDREIPSAPAGRASTLAAHSPDTSTPQRAAYSAPGGRNGDSTTPVLSYYGEHGCVLEYCMTAVQAGAAVGFYWEALNEAIVAMGDTGHRVRLFDYAPLMRTAPRFQRLQRERASYA